MVLLSFLTLVPVSSNSLATTFLLNSLCETRHTSFPSSVRPFRQLIYCNNTDTPTGAADVKLASSSSTDSSSTQLPSIVEPPSTDVLSSFSDAVSGEWFGYEVTFSGRTGDALEIEERYVPEDYRNWGVSITGFDTLTSSMTSDVELSVRLTRALPTVGCEADAIAGDISDKVFSLSEIQYFADGSYTFGPKNFEPNDLSQTFSFCIIHPTIKKKRARITFGRIDEHVSKVIVVLESWDSQYNGGAILPGCGGPDGSFATEKRTEGNDAMGNWSIVRQRYGKTIEEKERFQIIQRDEIQNVFGLPRGLYVRISKETQLGEILVETAWQPDEKHRSILTRVYDVNGGNLVDVRHDIERKI